MAWSEGEVCAPLVPSADQETVPGAAGRAEVSGVLCAGTVGPGQGKGSRRKDQLMQQTPPTLDAFNSVLRDKC